MIAAADSIEEPQQLPEIQFDDFTKVELRVARIIECEPVKKAKKLSSFRLMTEQQSQGRLFREFHNGYKPGDLIENPLLSFENLQRQSFAEK